MLKLKHEIEIKDFIDVGEGYKFLVMFKSYPEYGGVSDVDLMEGSKEDVIEFLRDVFAGNNKDLSFQEIMEIVEDEDKDELRIFFKEN